MAGYSEYLNLPQLLALQETRSEHRLAEMAFIVVHQVHELWFKLVIEDIGAAIAALDDDDLPSMLRHLRRVVSVERLLVDQMDLIDHMDPGEFAGIRAVLGTASAAESRQFASIEALSAPRRRSTMPDIALPDGTVPPAGPNRNLWSALCAHIRRSGLEMPGDDSDESRALRTRSVVEIYRVRRGLLVDACEALLDHDHTLCIWRHRHSLTAARHIGDNPGTGGSSGVPYLENRMSRRFFPELWGARTILHTSVDA